MLENDANAAALAEARMGAARKQPYVLLVTIGTGVGTGFIINNQIYRGAYDTEGGEITVDAQGPVCTCGGRGHFEAYVSGRAIKHRFGQMAYDIKDADTWDQIAKDISIGLHSMITLLSPSIVVLGGGVDANFNHFKRPLAKYLRASYPRYPLPKVVPAKFVETGVVQGCCILAHDITK